MWDFTTPYARFVDYTNRKEAVDPREDRLVEGIDQETAKEIAEKIEEQNLDYVGYIDYMKRNYATKVNDKDRTGIFTDKTLNADVSEAKKLKEMLNQAHENKSILWRGVVSFDNNFLKENGIYDPDTGFLNQTRLKQVMQKTMSNVVRREHLSRSSFWWGNIHLNTDNVHIHIGLSEIHSERPMIYYAPRNRKERKGKFSQKTIKVIKSNVYNGLLREDSRQRNLEYEKKIATLRDELLKKIEQKEIEKLNRVERFFLNQALEHFPEGKKLRYKSNAIDFKMSKFFIARYVDYQLQSDPLLYQNYQKYTRKLLENYQGVYQKGTAREKNELHQKLVKSYGVQTARAFRNGQMDRFLAKREAELRERLGNRTLNYIQSVVVANKNKGIRDLSLNNQERIQNEDPKATKVHSAKVWEQMGYKIKSGAISITLVVPLSEEEKEALKTAGKDISDFKEELFYDERFVEPFDPKRVKSDIDFTALKSMQKNELFELVETSRNILEEDPDNIKVKQRFGIFKYALRQKIIEERAEEIAVTRQLLEKYQPKDELTQNFVRFKQSQLAELAELADLKKLPIYRLTKGAQEQKEQLAHKYLNVVQISVSKVNAKVCQEQIARFEHEIKLAKHVTDESVFKLLKGDNATKESYLSELEDMKQVINIKFLIFTNNNLIKQTSDPRKKKQLRIQNGKYFTELKKLYHKLSPEEYILAKSQLEWDYQYDKSFRRKISATFDQRRLIQKTHVKKAYQRATHKFVKGAKLALKDDSDKREYLLKVLDRNEEKERER